MYTVTDDEGNILSNALEADTSIHISPLSDDEYIYNLMLENEDDLSALGINCTTIDNDADTFLELFELVEDNGSDVYKRVSNIYEAVKQYNGSIENHLNSINISITEEYVSVGFSIADPRGQHTMTLQVDQKGRLYIATPHEASSYGHTPLKMFAPGYMQVTNNGREEASTLFHDTYKAINKQLTNK